MSGDKGSFANPMPEVDENFLKEYDEELKSLLRKGCLPADKNEKRNFTVYLLAGSDWRSHWSIVLSPDRKKFFSVELVVKKIMGINTIYPRSREIPAGWTSKLQYCGEVEMSTLELLSTAIATMKRFGSYSKLSKNCQDFCNYYLESIGLGNAKKLTDSDKGVLISLAGTVAGILFACTRGK